MEGPITLKDKLDGFIRKYYLNLLLRGGLSAMAIVLAALLSAVILEHFGHFGVTVRSILFYGLLASSAGVLWFWVAVPVLGLFRLGKVINHDEAARIVGAHFSNVSDRLLNALQLERAAVAGGSELLLASIDQRARELRPVPFPDAIDLGQNLRLLRYALPPTLIIFGILMVRPALFLDSSKRILSHRTEFLPVAPFTFQILNEQLVAAQNEDFTLNLAINGADIPNEVFIEMNGARYLMAGTDGGFSYTFRNVNSNTAFRFQGGGFSSTEHTLSVLSRPSISGMSVTLDYPKYLGLRAERLSNTGDLTVPEGTRITWNIESVATDRIVFLADSIAAVSSLSGGRFSHSVRARKDMAYQLALSNQTSPLSDTLSFRIQVVPDLYPTLSVEEARDTTTSGLLFFRAQAKDDYGLSALHFSYRMSNQQKEADWIRESVALPSSGTSIGFYHSFKVDGLDLKPGDEVEYFFEVWDNDGVNGAKSVKSQVGVYRLPTLGEQSQENQERNDAVTQQLKSAISEAKDIKKELNALQQQTLEKKSLDWQDRKRIETLLDRQKELEKNVEQLGKQNQNRMDRMSDSFENQERLMEKQAKLQELFNEVMTDEMKALYEKMERMMDELNKDKLQEALDEMKFNAEDLEKELDRSLELFKQLELEQKMAEAKARLEDLAKKQDELSKESEKQGKDSEPLEQKQDELNKEFKELEKELEDIKEKNEALEKPNEMDGMEKQREEVNKEQKESKEKLGQKQNQKAAQNQKKAAQKMNDMAQKMESMMQQMQQEGQEEDMNALRQILENLLSLSFDQESLIKDLKSMNRNDPKYVDAAREQRKLKEDSKLIEDSLFALSKRVEQIKTAINREIREVNHNMAKALDEMGNRNTPVVLGRQQSSLTSINNLALLLSEALQQMQEAMAKASGSGSCSKPGSKPGQGKNPSAASMRQLQEELNKRMDAMQKAMEKNGSKPGTKPGQKPGQGGSMSKELAQMAAQQEALRGMIRDYESKMNQQKGGKGSGGALGDLSQKMEQTEKDIVNKTITQETIRRQQDILTKLLEAEKSEREREMENRRESHEAKEEKLSNPEDFFKYKPVQRNETELLLTVPIDLSPFYRGKVDEYFRRGVN